MIRQTACGLDFFLSSYNYLFSSQFWDARAPRVGEEGRLGWCKALEQRQIGTYGEQQVSCMKGLAVP